MCEHFVSREPNTRLDRHFDLGFRHQENINFVQNCINYFNMSHKVHDVLKNQCIAAQRQASDK